MQRSDEPSVRRSRTAEAWVGELADLTRGPERRTTEGGPQSQPGRWHTMAPHQSTLGVPLLQVALEICFAGNQTETPRTQ